MRKVKLSGKLNEKKNYQYLVKWKNYPSTWEHEAEELIKEFENSQQ